MADIELIIRISEKDYEYIKELGFSGYTDQTNRIVEAISNGIVIPKEHGDLIDKNILPINEVYEENYNWECGETTRHTLDVVYWEDILNAPTIIESNY